MTTTADIDQIDRVITDIGSSDAATILGLWGAEARKRLLKQKRGEIPALTTNRAMREGIHMEPWIAKEWMREAGVNEADYEKPARKFMHPTIPWMVTHVDLLSRDGEHLIEIKNSRAGRTWRNGHGDLEMPASVVAQEQHSACVITTVRRITVVGYVCEELYVEDLAPDAALQQTILEAEHEFRACVEDHTKHLPPAVLEDLREIYGEPEQEKSVTATAQIVEKLGELSELRTARGDYANKTGPFAKRIKQLEFEIAEWMEDAGQIDDGLGSPIYVRSMRAAHTRPACQIAACETSRFTKWWK